MSIFRKKEPKVLNARVSTGFFDSGEESWDIEITLSDGTKDYTFAGLLKDTYSLADAHKLARSLLNENITEAISIRNDFFQQR